MELLCVKNGSNMHEVTSRLDHGEIVPKKSGSPINVLQYT